MERPQGYDPPSLTPAIVLLRPLMKPSPSVVPRHGDETARDLRARLASTRPSREAAEAAVRTLLAWAGEDIDREGLLETPARVARAYEEMFSGYAMDPEATLATTFKEVDGYDEMVTVRDIRMESHCEHHMVPFLGKAHVAYLPKTRVVGLSKIARLVEGFAKRFQVQERLTVQIADALEHVLSPRGVAVVVEAEHFCMTTRGVRKPGAITVTSRMTGAFRNDPSTRREFLAMIGHVAR